MAHWFALSRTMPMLNRARALCCGSLANCASCRTPATGVAGSGRELRAAANRNARADVSQEALGPVEMHRRPAASSSPRTPAFLAQGAPQTGLCMGQHRRDGQPLTRAGSICNQAALPALRTGERCWGVPFLKNGGQPETEGGVSALDRNLAHIYRPQEDND